MLIIQDKERVSKLKQIEIMCDEILSHRMHLSHSSFSAFLKSPLHFFHYKYGEKEQTKDKDFGKLFDLFLFEPKQFNKQYIEYSKEQRPVLGSTMVKKENKDWLNGLKEEAKEQGKTLVESKEIAYSKQMAQAVNNSERVMSLLNMCDTTQEKVDFVWNGFRWLGFKDKSCHELTVDLKTAQGAQYWKFRRSIRDYGYHRQGAIYNLGDGDLFKPYFLLAVEKKPPFAIAMNHLSRETLLTAKNELEKGLGRFRECLIDQSKFLQSYEFWAEKTHGIFEVNL